jgi:hypothetical protein
LIFSIVCARSSRRWPRAKTSTDGTRCTSCKRTLFSCKRPSELSLFQDEPIFYRTHVFLQLLLRVQETIPRRLVRPLPEQCDHTHQLCQTERRVSADRTSVPAAGRHPQIMNASLLKKSFYRYIYVNIKYCRAFTPSSLFLSF